MVKILTIDYVTYVYPFNILSQRALHLGNDLTSEAIVIR